MRRWAAVSRGTRVSLTFASRALRRWRSRSRSRPVSSPLRLGDGLRMLLLAMVAPVGAAWVPFKVRRAHRRVPLLLDCVPAALFVRFAESIRTLAGA